MQIGGRHFEFGRRAYVMGILNVTPDSFSDGGLHLDPERALDRALRLQEEGADLIDVGAESTRPGSRPVPEDVEKSRLIPVLKKIIPRLTVPVSVDTQKSSVADAALAEGASLVNDVSALRDPRMKEVIARHDAPLVLMHMRGTPETMQEDPRYDDVVSEVFAFLEAKTREAREAGLTKILVDPGFGFGKRFEDNLALLGSLSRFTELKRPLVVGMSRKSFLRRIFGEGDREVLAGSASAAALAVRSGASIVRVHDVAPTRAAIHLAMGVQSA